MQGFLLSSFYARTVFHARYSLHQLKNLETVYMYTLSAINCTEQEQNSCVHACYS